MMNKIIDVQFATYVSRFKSDGTEIKETGNESVPAKSVYIAQTSYLFKNKICHNLELSLYYIEKRKIQFW